LKKPLKSIFGYKNKRLLEKLDRKFLVAKVRAENLTYLSDGKMISLLGSLNKVNDDGIEGCFLETGVALGGSLVVISGNREGRNVFAYDTFEMIPAPTEDDPIEVHERYKEISSGKSLGIGGETYYGYRDDLLSFVSERLTALCGTEASRGTMLIKGLLQETMEITEPVAFAHIDVDWYDPVKFSINSIWPYVSQGGIVIFDDYDDWGGCRKAVNEFFENRSDFEFDLSGGNLKVTKSLRGVKRPGGMTTFTGSK
jgi:asparagine synthase (glutamine-hydrolysing)